MSQPPAWSPHPAEASVLSSPHRPGRQAPVYLQQGSGGTPPMVHSRPPTTMDISLVWLPFREAVVSPREAASASSSSLELRLQLPVWLEWPRCSIRNWERRRATSIRNSTHWPFSRPRHSTTRQLPPAA